MLPSLTRWYNLLNMVELNLKRLCFFVALHKDAPLPPACDHYVALGLGGYKPTTSMRAFSDDIGNSIVNKHRHYSELTGWYWIWKNVSDIKILGLSHYRRYFVLDEDEWWLFRRRNRRRSGLKIDGRLSLTPKPPAIRFQPSAQSFAYITAPERTRFLEETLSRYDVIVPRRQTIIDGMCLSQQYVSAHFQEDWDLFVQGIQELYPQYSGEIKWFDKTNYIHRYNMMIAPKTFFDTYMSSLFPLLFWMEEKRPFRTDDYQCRVPAFLAERFFTFYLHVTGAMYTEAPIAISELTAL